jgi:hypothetical protein
MFVKVLQTRHTKIGTLRSGTILDVEQLGENGGAVIEALLKQKNSALKKLTKKQAEAEKEAVVSLEPTVDLEDKTSIDIDVLGDLQKTLSDAEKLNTGLQVDLTAMTTDRNGQAETAKSEADRAAKAEAFAKGETKRADKAEGFAKDEAKRADAAENDVKLLKADLDKAQKALTDAAKKSVGDKK